MSSKKIVLLLIALLIGGLTVFLARSMIAGGPEAPQAVAVKVNPVKEILVAAKDLPAGTILKEADMRWQDWPIKDEEKTDFAVKGKVEMSAYTGNVVRQGLREGEPLMAGRVVKPGEHGFMAAAIAPGMRAVSISITPVAGVAGFVYPGDRIDVLVTHQIGGHGGDMGPQGRKVSETVLRNVRVLALDQKMSDQVTEPKIAQIATLEVTPKQAETVALASELGTLSLSLRSIASDPATADAQAPEAATLDQGADQAKPADQAKTDLALDASALAAEAAKKMPEITWDSDVSRVLPHPANRVGAVQKVKIIRGKETTESVYDLTQP